MSPDPHRNMARADLHADRNIKDPVRAASTANITLTAPGATIDGVTLVSGDRVLLKDQTAAAQNGIYIWTGSASTLTRATDLSATADFVFGFKVYVREGGANGGSYWTYTQSGAVTVGTTAITFSRDGAGNVTSVGLTMPGGFNVTGSPITGSGFLGVTETTQGVNTVKAGPASGGTGAVSYRALVPADLPVMGASGGSHAAGAAPDPGSSAGTTRFLREDAIWATPTGGGGGGGSGATSSLLYQQTRIRNSGNKTTTSTSFVAVDNTNLPPLSLTLAVGDVVRCVLACQAATSSGGVVEFDFQVVQPTLGTVRTNSTATAGATSLGTTNHIPATVVATFTAAEAGTHTFQAMFAQGIGGQTSTIYNSNASGDQDTEILFTVEKVGASLVAQSASAAATTTGGTITTAGVSEARVSPAAAVTGVILQAGTYGGQEVSVVNEAVAANTVTFAAAGTSNVADGTSSVIAGLTARRFVWNSSTSLWYAGGGGSGGGGGTTNVGDVVLAATATTITLSSIPQTGKALRLMISARSTLAANNEDRIAIQINTDTGTNYTSSDYRSNNGGQGNTRSVAGTSGFIGMATAASSSSGHFGVTNAVFPNYAQTISASRSWTATSSHPLASDNQVDLIGGIWLGTAAITSITLLLPSGASFDIGTMVHLEMDP